MDASPKEKFEAAVKVIQTLPKNVRDVVRLSSFQPSYSLMQKFYGYYKQATTGPCDTPRPAFWDVIGRAKWEAWSSLGEMSSEEAMASYVNELKKMIETMPQTPMVTDFISKLGDFYELIDDHMGNHYRRLKPLLNTTRNTEIDSVEPMLEGNVMCDLESSFNGSPQKPTQDMHFEKDSEKGDIQHISKSALQNPIHSTLENMYFESDSEEGEFYETVNSTPIQLLTEEYGIQREANKLSPLKTLESIPVTHTSKRYGLMDESHRKIPTNADVISILVVIQEDISLIKSGLKKIEENMKISYSE